MTFIARSCWLWLLDSQKSRAYLIHRKSVSNQACTVVVRQQLGCKSVPLTCGLAPHTDAVHARHHLDSCTQLAQAYTGMMTCLQTDRVDCFLIDGFAVICYKHRWVCCNLLQTPLESLYEKSRILHIVVCACSTTMVSDPLTRLLMET